MSAIPILTALALTTACGSRERYTTPQTLKVTVLCDAETTHQTCESALRSFVAAHPDDRITSLNPIVGPDGTQGMLVVHTNERAPYALLRDVHVVGTSCDSLQTCASTVRSLIADYPDATVWAIVSDQRDQSVMRAIALLGPRSEMEVQR